MITKENKKTIKIVNEEENEYFSKGYVFGEGLEDCASEMICHDCGLEIDADEQTIRKYGCQCPCHNLV